MAEQVKYPDWSLKGNVVALGGNLWNQYVRESLLAPDGKDDLGCAARAFFDKILPELHNFVEQKIAHEKKQTDLQVDELKKDNERLKEGLMEIFHTGASSRMKDFHALPAKAENLLKGGTSCAAQNLIIEHVKVKDRIWKELDAANRLVGELRKALEEIYKNEGPGLDGSSENASGRIARLALEGKTEKRVEPVTIEDLLGECRECNRLVRDCGNHDTPEVGKDL